ncbi:MAG: class I SAM-dependent methyltransferase [Planctomycetaceae bacterium]
MSTLRAFESHRAVTLPQESSVELEAVDCLLCGGQDHETVIVASDPVTKIGGNFRVVRCRDCGLSFTNPRPTINSIGRFYPDSYGPYTGRDEDALTTGGWRHTLTQAVMRADFGYPPAAPIDLKTRMLALAGRMTMRRSRQRQSWIPFRAPGRLLDFGCGAGDFLKRMRELGWTVEGMDFSEKVAREIFDSSGIRVHLGSLPHPDIRPEQFDAVTMWNSLEHVHQPREVVRAAGQALRRGGLLVVGVPNFESWSYEHFRDSWYALELPRHLTHFTPETLCETVCREGFKVLSIQQIARAGCLRKSARRATASGSRPAWLRAARWKPWGLMLADYSERIGRADFMRVIAEKR